MAAYRYVVADVFTDTPLTGNQLAVFTDARGLDDATMQALALQFNVSETTFVLPSERGTARVRIFTPTFEMPFAGHPTLGTAHVVRELMQAGDRVTLELRAGLIPVRADKDVWSLTANAPRFRAPSAARSELASMLGLEAGDLAGDPLWIDTGAEQLIVPLASFDAVRRSQPVAAAMLRYATNDVRAMAYVFARDGEQVLARFFFLKHGAVIEDPGTGSACANLGGYLLATNAALPLQLSIDQGEAVGRRCRLGLTVLPDRSIHVAGRVIEIGRGALTL